MKKVKRKALSLMLVVSLLLGMTPDVPAMAAKAARGLADCIESIVVTESSLLQNNNKTSYVLDNENPGIFVIDVKASSSNARASVSNAWASASNVEKASISNASSSNAAVAIVSEITADSFLGKTPSGKDLNENQFLLKVTMADGATAGSSATITVSVGGKETTFSVNVPEEKEESQIPTITITSENNKTEVEMGKTLQFRADVNPENSDYVGIWSSTNSHIATVDSYGLVTPLQVGATEVTYSVTGTWGTASSYMIIKVIPAATPETPDVPVESIYMYSKEESNSMGIDESRQINAFAHPDNATNKTLEFTSSDDSIATVVLSTESSNSAIVTGLKAGKVTITAAATDGSKVTSNMEFEVLDVEEVTKVTVNNGKNAKMRIGTKRNFSVTTEPANAVGLKQTWESSNTDIVTCYNGYVIAEGVGTATVSVTIKGVTSSFEVEVWAQELDLALSRTKVSLQEGTETTINAIITKPDSGRWGITEWKSSNEEVLEITEGEELWAIIKAKSSGTAVLTATLDGKEATCEVTVTKDVVVPTPADKMDAALEENRDKLYSDSPAEQEVAVKNIFNAVQDAMKDVKVDSISDDDMTAISNMEDIILSAMSNKFNSTDWDQAGDVEININEIKGALLNLPIDWPAAGGLVRAKMTIANAPTTGLAIPSGVTGAQAFEINLEAVSDARTESLTDLKVPVEINMEIPDELLSANNLWVYNYHGSNIIKIKPTIHDNGTMTIRVNKFSPFVLMDIPTGGGGSSSSSGSSNSSMRDNNLKGQWVQDSTGWWFKTTTGGYPKNDWAMINNKWYHFDTVGYMQTGWILLNNSWYYLKSDGAMASKEWIAYNGKQYYLHDNGTMMSNQWFSYNNNWYYMGTDGAMLTNATAPDGHKVDASGVWVK